MKTVKKVKAGQSVQQIHHKVKYPLSNDHIDFEVGYYIDEEDTLVDFRNAYESDNDHRFFN